MSSAAVLQEEGFFHVVRRYLDDDEEPYTIHLDQEDETGDEVIVEANDLYFDILNGYDSLDEQSPRARFHVILDLDGTLINTMHKSVGPIEGTPDFEDEALDFYTFKRPGLDKFLRYCFSRFASVSVWTAGTEAYAEYIATNILPPGCTFMYILHRDYCTPHPLIKNALVKNLYDLWNSECVKALGISEDNTVIIDDNDEVCFCNLENAIIVKAWCKGEDNQLLSLMRYFDASPAETAKSLCYLLN